MGEKQQKQRRTVIKQTELERLQNEMVAAEPAPEAPKKKLKPNETRMMAMARHASGPYAGTNWRRYGG